MRTDLCCALTHPEKPKVSRPSTRVEHVGTDALAVVADSHLQGGVGIGHLRLDLLGARMPERITERLACDEQHLFAHDRVQIPMDSLDARPKQCRVRQRELFAFGRERLGQVRDIAPRSAQILYPVATFPHYLIRPLQRLLHEVSRRLVVVYAISHRLEAPNQPLYTLKQGVV